MSTTTRAPGLTLALAGISLPACRSPGAPNGVHQVSANASKQDSVRFLASFACDHDPPLTKPAPGAR